MIIEPVGDSMLRISFDALAQSDPIEARGGVPGGEALPKRGGTATGRVVAKEPLASASATAAMPGIPAFIAAIDRADLPGVQDVVPSATALSILYKPAEITYETLRECLESLRLSDPVSKALASRVHEIPVCYGGDFGLDLGVVARTCGITEQEVIALHCGTDYVVRMVGFAPGFGYLSGLPSLLSIPRRATPRPRVAAGSVAIGGAMTAVYPLETPGGWHILGRTSVKMYDPDRDPPSLLAAGDTVRFVDVAES